jgi:DNA polymerase-3 subunit delta
VDAAGIMVRVWPLDHRALPRWIERRMGAKGLLPDRETVDMIAHRVEGNLLAAAQEIDKLVLLNGPGALDPAHAAAAVADSARYDVFTLVDSVLAGDTGRALHILDGLRMEGETEPIVLWALADGVRRLHAMAERMAAGASLERLLSEPGVMERRKPLLRAALRQGRLAGWRHLLRGCARVDRVIKGMETGRPWDALLALTVDLTETCAGRRSPFQLSSTDTPRGTQP